MILRGVVLAAVATLGLAAPAAAVPQWRLEQPPVEGVPWSVALGPPGDLQFWAPNRGLMTVQGNAAVPRGVYVYNGRGWRSYATVCGSGDAARHARIAWAGPTEFWTIADAAADQEANTGGTLCRFRDGAVIASYVLPVDSAEQYWPMNAAACNGPADCWFAGAGSAEVGRGRLGFRLHFDGASLTTHYDQAENRATSDLQAHAGRVHASMLRGVRDEQTIAVNGPQDPAQLLRSFSGTTRLFDPFATPDSSFREFLALDSDGTQLWAGGGDARSGPNFTSAPARLPYLARRVGTGPFQEVPLIVDADDDIEPRERIVDLAAIPGTTSVWAALQNPTATGTQRAKLARIEASGEVTAVVSLPLDTGRPQDAPRGAAARVECAAATECWMVTTDGWVFHYSEAGATLEQDTDPAFAGLITIRPPDARTRQAVPDAPPVDDSLLFAPPPVELEAQQETEQAAATAKTLPALMTSIRTRTRGRGSRRTIVVSFRLRRRARVGLVASRGGRVVARAKQRTLKPGRRSLNLRVTRKRWPTKLRFTTTELDLPDGTTQSPGSDNNTGGDDVSSVLG